MQKLYTLEDCHTVELTKIGESRGNLTFIEGRQHVPFDIKRVYYIYDVPAGSERAGHAHKELFQLLIAPSGSFDVHLNDGFDQRVVALNRPYVGLLVTPMVWRVIDNFSSGSICLALASAPFDEADYFREYDDFVRAVRRARKIQLVNPETKLPNPVT
jgi:hypothetical protein